MSSDTEFKYQALARDGPSIRLIKLLKGSRGIQSGRPDAIRCEVQISYIGSSRLKYDAVSYYWGQGKRTETIHISGAPFKVSRVVLDLLVRLREENRDRLLWLDLICIDQNNFEERAAQVKRMREIFGEAETVVVSLGPHASIGLAEQGDDPFGSRVTPLEHAQDYNAIKTVKKYSDLNPFALSSENVRDDMIHFLGHPWFDRVWVLQEVALAKRLLVVCGEHSLDGKEFAKLYGRRLLDRIQNERLKARLKQLRPLFEFMAGNWLSTHPKPELLAVLQSFRRWQATDSRDKVFALLGLSNDGPQARALDPDYQASVETVYQRVAQYMISRYDSLSVLTYAAYPTEEVNSSTKSQAWLSWALGLLSMAGPASQLPSWCPDWRQALLLGDPESSGSAITSNVSWHRLGPQVVQRSDCDTDSLSVRGYTIASIHGTGSVEIVIPEDMQKIMGYLPTSLSNIAADISADLTSLSSSLSKATGKGLRKDDRICLLEGTTGVAILRPSGDVFQLINLRHSAFARIRFSMGPRLMQDHSPLERLIPSVYADIPRCLARIPVKAAVPSLKPTRFDIV